MRGSPSSPSANGRVRMRHPVPGPRGGGLYVSKLQRTRLLGAAFALVFEQGYRGMTVRKVSARAGVSSKTFYDLFADREDCFLAAFDHGVDQLAAVARSAAEGEDDWVARVRAGLGALLGCLDREPELSRLVFVEALGAGPRVLARRAGVLEELAEVIDEGRAGAKAAAELPSLTAEGIVGAACGVLYARIVKDERGSLRGLLNQLMATIMLPYRGRATAARELARPVSPAGLDFGPADQPARHLGRGTSSLGRPARESQILPRPIAMTSGSLRPDFRLTIRTHTVLVAVSEHPGASNREVSDLVHVPDQGHISRLMARLEDQGLLENTGGRAQGVPKAWRLTPHGEAVVQANRPLDERTA